MPATEEKSALNLYPVALDLRGRRCVVVGGGSVAARKAEGLLDANASVIVIAPELGGIARNMAAGGHIHHVAERFVPSHLDGAFLAVAATDDMVANQEVAEAARTRNVLFNQAGAFPDSAHYDGDPNGDFVTMASVQRGELLIAITTGGAGPALVARLARNMHAQFGPEWAEYVALLREMRELAKVRWSDDARTRTAMMRKLANSDSVLDALRQGDHEGARREALSCLS